MQLSVCPVTAAYGFLYTTVVRAACRTFGVYHPGGFPQRALMIVGPDVRVRWSYQAPSPAELPGANLIFDGLAA